MLIVSSDWHCQPEELIPQARHIIEKADPGKDLLVGVGDLFNFLPLGKDKFKNSKAIDDFIRLLGGQTFYYVTGNHDPYPWVKQRFKDYPNIVVARIVNFKDRWYFRHGHGWSHDWWLLRHFAPRVVEFMTEHFPRFWYCLSRKMGWLPSKQKEVADVAPSERQKYDDAVGIVWRNDIQHAQHNNLAVIVGHTHCSGILRRALSGVRAVIADGGNLGDGTYLLIDDDIRLCTLP